MVSLPPPAAGAAVTLRRLAMILLVMLIGAWRPADLLSDEPQPSSDAYGGIDFGSRGIKRVVLQRKNGKLEPVVFENIAADKEANKSVNAGLAKAMGADGFFKKKDVADACQVVKGHLEALEQTYHVPVNHIWIVISSGLADAARKNPDGNGVNPNGEEALKVLKAEIQRTCTGLIQNEIEVISGEDEATATFAGNVWPYATVPRTENEASQGFAIDVGSGNTKMAMGKIGKTVGYGTTRLKRAEEGAAHAALAKQIGPVSTTFPDRDNVRALYLSGGAAYIVTVLMIPDQFAAEPKGEFQLDREQFDATVKKILSAKNKDELFADLKNKAAGNPAALAQLKDAEGVFSLDLLKEGVWLLNDAVQLFPPKPKLSIYFCGAGETAFLRVYLDEKLPVPPSSDHQKLGELDVDIQKLKAETKRLEEKLQDQAKRIDRLEQRLPGNTTNGKPEQIVDRLSALQSLSKLDKLDQLDKLTDIDRKLANLDKRLDQTIAVIDAKLADLPTRADVKRIEDRLPKALESPRGDMRPSLPATGMSAAYLYGEGLTSMRSQRWAIAADELTESLRADPSNATAWYLRGVCYLHLRDQSSGFDSIQQAGRIIGDDSLGYARICRASESFQGEFRNQAEQLLGMSRTSKLAAR
jgi:hypothetical protein